MLMGISGHFIDERKALGVMKTRDNHAAVRGQPAPREARGERVQPFAGPVAILVDALSGSASECFAGGMQSLGRVRVFGQHTMGQALPALFSRLPNGDVLIHAYGDFVTADGTRLEGRGVVPDERRTARSRRSCSAGRDRTLEAALAWFDTVNGGRTDRSRWSVKYCAGGLPLLHSSHLRERFPATPHRNIGRIEWSSAGCVWATFWTTTVHASDA